MRITIRKFLPVALIAAFVSACADAPTSAVRISPSLPGLHVVPVATPEVELLLLCKTGPVGTYSFNATSNQPVLRDPTTGVFNRMAATYSIVVSAGSTINVGGTILPGACYQFSGHNYIALAGGGTLATVTVVESGIPAGINFDRVVVYQNNAGTVTSSSSTTNSASGQVGGASIATLGASITFFNVLTPTGCTYTKGWYRNNGSSTVIGVDGRTAAQARAIFDATPGKPGGVTWGADNDNLNLYQQLLAALNNLGGNATAGPPAVDVAIAAALAATSGTGLNIIVAPGTNVSGLIDTLSAFNEGEFAGWPHCDD